MSTQELTQLQKQLDRIEKAANIAAKRVLNFEEVMHMTGFSKGTLYKLTCAKHIPYSKKGGRLFFDKNEIEGWLLENRQATEQELNSAASTYIAIRR